MVASLEQKTDALGVVLLLKSVQANQTLKISWSIENILNDLNSVEASDVADYVADNNGTITISVPNEHLDTLKQVGRFVGSVTWYADGQMHSLQADSLVVIGAPEVEEVDSVHLERIVKIQKVEMNEPMMSKLFSDKAKVVFRIKNRGLYWKDSNSEDLIQELSLTEGQSVYDSLDLEFDLKSTNAYGKLELDSQVIFLDENNKLSEAGEIQKHNVLEIPVSINSPVLKGFDTHGTNGEGTVFFEFFNPLVNGHEVFENYTLEWTVTQSDKLFEGSTAVASSNSGSDQVLPLGMDSDSVKVIDQLSGGDFTVSMKVVGTMKSEYGGLEKNSDTKTTTYKKDVAPEAPTLELESVEWESGQQKFKISAPNTIINMYSYSYMFSSSDTAPDGLTNTSASSELSLSVALSHENIIPNPNNGYYLYASYQRKEINGYVSTSYTRSEVKQFSGILAYKIPAALNASDVAISGYSGAEDAKAAKVAFQSDRDDSTFAVDVDGQFIMNIENPAEDQEFSVILNPSPEPGKEYKLEIYKVLTLVAPYIAANSDLDKLNGDKYSFTSGFQIAPKITSMSLRPVAVGNQPFPYANSQSLQIARMEGELNGHAVKELVAYVQGQDNTVEHRVLTSSAVESEFDTSNGDKLHSIINVQNDSVEDHSHKILQTFIHDFDFGKNLTRKFVFGVIDTPSSEDAFKWNAENDENADADAVAFTSAVSEFNAAKSAYEAAKVEYDNWTNSSDVLDRLNGELSALTSSRDATLANNGLKATFDDKKDAYDKAVVNEATAKTEMDNAKAAMDAASVAADKIELNEQYIEDAVSAWSKAFSNAPGVVHDQISWDKWEYNSESKEWEKSTKDIPYPAGTSGYTDAYLQTKVQHEASLTAVAHASYQGELSEYNGKKKAYDDRVDDTSDAETEMNAAQTAVTDNNAEIESKEGEIVEETTKIANAEKTLKDARDDAMKQTYGSLQDNGSEPNYESPIATDVMLSDGTPVTNPKVKVFYDALKKYYPPSL